MGSRIKVSLSSGSGRICPSCTGPGVTTSLPMSSFSAPAYGHLSNCCSIFNRPTRGEISDHSFSILDILHLSFLDSQGRVRFHSRSPFCD